MRFLPEIRQRAKNPAWLRGVAERQRFCDDRFERIRRLQSCNWCGAPGYLGGLITGYNPRDYTGNTVSVRLLLPLLTGGTTLWLPPLRIDRSLRPSLQGPSPGVPRASTVEPNTIRSIGFRPWTPSTIRSLRNSSAIRRISWWGLPDLTISPILRRFPRGFRRHGVKPVATDRLRGPPPGV